MMRQFFHSPIILLSVVSLAAVSCAPAVHPLASIDAQQSKEVRSPQMLGAKTTAPSFVTAPAERVFDDPAVPIAAVKEADSQELQQSHESTVVDSKTTSSPSSVVAAGSKREQEHVSFTSYNPFETADSFTVDLLLEAENFHYPIDGQLLSPYGQRGRSWHSGSDLKGQAGDPIFAVFDGEVRMSRNYAGYGNIVVLRHNNGLETAYSHNSSNLVKVGDKVKAGQKIALCGRTGRATGTHCHFEVRILGQAVNPALLLDFNNRTIQKGAIVVSKNANNKVLAKRIGEGSPQESISRPAAPTQIVASNQTPIENAVAQPVTASNSSNNNSNDYSTTIITAASANQTPKPSTTTAASANKNSNANNRTPKYHTITQGDTLYALALKYGTTVQKICALNNISEKKVLQLKQKLRIL